MRREYFLTPSVESTRKIVDEVSQAGIEERHIHVVAKEGTPLEDLPEASLLEKTDYIHAIEVGLAGGGAVGLLSGLIALNLPGAVVGGAAVLYIALAGAGIGAWLSGLVGLDYSAAN